MPTRDLTRVVVRVILIVLLAVGSLELLWLVRKPLGWIVLALFVAVAMSRPVARLELRMPRSVAIAASYFALLLIPVTIAALIVPTVVTGGQDLAEKAPGYVTDLQKSVAKNPKLRKLDRQYGITDKLQEEAAKLPSKAGDAANVLKDVGVGVLNSVFTAVTVLVLSIFMVSNGRSWVLAALKAIPDEDRRARVERGLESSADAVGNYVGGLIIQMSIAGASTFVVLSVLDVPFAAPLAVVMALLDAIPLVGASRAAVLIGIITLFVGFPGVTIAWVVWAVLYQQIENYLIQPRIQSRAVDVHAFVVLVSVLFGSTLFGIAGALLAIPVAASLQIGLREYLIYREDMKVMRMTTGEHGGPPPPASPGPPEIITP
jgi:predicted PurR-regulated permease PerM